MFVRSFDVTRSTCSVWWGGANSHGPKPSGQVYHTCNDTAERFFEEIRFRAGAIIITGPPPSVRVLSQFNFPPHAHTRAQPGGTRPGLGTQDRVRPAALVISLPFRSIVHNAVTNVFQLLFSPLLCANPSLSPTPTPAPTPHPILSLTRGRFCNGRPGPRVCRRKRP